MLACRGNNQQLNTRTEAAISHDSSTPVPYARKFHSCVGVNYWGVFTTNQNKFRSRRCHEQSSSDKRLNINPHSNGSQPGDCSPSFQSLVEPPPRAASPGDAHDASCVSSKVVRLCRAKPSSWRCGPWLRLVLVELVESIMIQNGESI